MSVVGKRFEIAWRDRVGASCGAYGTPPELALVLHESGYDGAPIALRGDTGEVVALVTAARWVPTS